MISLPSRVIRRIRRPSASHTNSTSSPSGDFAEHMPIGKQNLAAVPTPFLLPVWPLPASIDDLPASHIGQRASHSTTPHHTTNHCAKRESHDACSLYNRCDQL